MQEEKILLKKKMKISKTRIHFATAGTEYCIFQGKVFLKISFESVKFPPLEVYAILCWLQMILNLVTEMRF